MSENGFFLGAVVEPGTGDRTETVVDYDPADLTTHGVIVGMTGSGKTGLGVIVLEEALRTGIPTLVIDPKGDMANLLLTFPDLAPADFEPWVDPAEARREGVSTAELAATKAGQWKEGLASWDLDGTAIADLRTRAGFTVYTPGSSAGVPLNIVGSLADPGLDWDTEAESLRDQIGGFASGLLGLLGIDADPITSREHILISNLVEHAWRQGVDLDLASLLGQIARPPLRKLGVFELDSFYPVKDRTELAMKLNGLLASPAFAEWVSGAPLDLDAMLWDGDGKPQAAIVYLAHLSDEERQFIVTLVLSKVVTWMRSQPGTSDLRTLVYMDEVFGFVPPTAEPPAKRPILTLLKQARAFGVGLLLSTQNPMDLDYKAMSNAGTWFIGRLQTERDKARIVEALQSAAGDRDVAALDTAISALGKRQFLLQSAHLPGPLLFTTRWALSYLAGPLTREQVARLDQGEASATAATPPGETTAADPALADTPPADIPTTETALTEDGESPGVTDGLPTVDAGAPAPPVADDETAVMPAVAEGVVVRHLDPAAPWAADVGADPAATALAPAVAARLRLTYDDRAAGIDHTEEWEAVVPIAAGFDPAAAIHVDYDDRDLVADGPAVGATYRIPEARIDTRTFWSDARRRLVDHLHRGQKLTVARNAALGLYSRPGESEEDFAARCDAAAQDRADAEAAKLRDKYGSKITAARKRFETADRRVSELQADVAGAQQGELLEGAGALIGILTGRRSTRSVTGSARRRSATQSKEARLATAQEKATGEWDDMAALETELTEELEQINDTWEAAAAETEEIEIGLEKTDIHVEDMVLLWIPS